MSKRLCDGGVELSLGMFDKGVPTCVEDAERAGEMMPPKTAVPARACAKTSVEPPVCDAKRRMMEGSRSRGASEIGWAVRLNASSYNCR